MKSPQDHTVSRAKDQPGGQVQRMGELEALLARVRTATGDDRGLDRDIFEAISMPAEFFGSKIESWARDGDHYTANTADGYRHIKCFGAGRYTASLDAVFGLVGAALPGWDCSAVKISGSPAEGYVWPHHQSTRQHQGSGATPALALLAALLTALSHQQPHDQIREGEE